MFKLQPKTLKEKKRVVDLDFESSEGAIMKEDYALVIDLLEGYFDESSSKMLEQKNVVQSEKFEEGRLLESKPTLPEQFVKEDVLPIVAQWDGGSDSDDTLLKQLEKSQQIQQLKEKIAELMKQKKKLKLKSKEYAERKRINMELSKLERKLKELEEERSQTGCPNNSLVEIKETEETSQNRQIE